MAEGFFIYCRKNDGKKRKGRLILNSKIMSGSFYLKRVLVFMRTLVKQIITRTEYHFAYMHSKDKCRAKTVFSKNNLASL